MKIKFEPNEFIVGEEYHGKIVEIGGQGEQLILRAYSYNEIFLIEDGIKHWLQNPQTATHHCGADWIKKYQTRSLDEINKYPTGETYNVIGEPQKAPDVYYPEPKKPYIFRGMRALLTLNPKPANAQIMKDLGFNVLIPYAGLVSGWDGDMIRTSPGAQVKYMFTFDEPDCHKRDPQTELQLLQKMKADNPGIPIGFCLCQAIGCGLDYIGGSVQATIEAWMEVANQADFVMCGVYAWRKGVDDPLWDMNAKWERYYSKLTVPFLPLLQAHWWDEPNEQGKQVLKPEIMPQLEDWFGRAQKGYDNISGYGVYCWADKWHGVRDMQDEWKKANEWSKNNV